MNKAERAKLICVVAFDTGVTTGAGFVVIRRSWLEKKVETHRLVKQAMRINGWSGFGEIPCRDEHAGIAGIVSACETLERRFGLDGIILEDFIPRPSPSFRVGRRDFLAPVRINAGVKYGLETSNIGRLRNMGVKMQTASQAKGVITNARLRQWGLWTGYSRHARDAMRHVLIYLRKLNQS